MRPSALVIFLAGAPALLAQSSPVYRITHTYTLAGEGGWDYVIPDPAHHRLFIARQNLVMVVDANDGHLLGEVLGIKGAHGTAVVESSGRGFATSAADSSVKIFDLATFQVIGQVHAAEDADAIIYDPASNRVFTFNGDAHSSTVIDPVAGTLGATDLPAGAYVVTSVEDTGTGIDPAALPRIFEPFFTDKPNGTGLGLSNVAAAVGEANGAVGVLRQPGRGTRFELWLPEVSGPTGVDLPRSGSRQTSPR